MRYEYSVALRADVTTAVQAALRAEGIVNITAVAEQVRKKNLAENVALEDVEHLVMQAAQLLGAAIEFDGLTGGSPHPHGRNEDGVIATSLDSGRLVSIQ